MMHGRIWAAFHPRQAAAEEAEWQETLRFIDEYNAQEAREAEAWENWLDREEAGMPKGNPPDSWDLDREIDRQATRFPEVGAEEREHYEIRDDILSRGPNMSYPEYEGPGFTEPPAWSPDYHEDHPDWTFTEWALSRGYSPELADDINREFTHDPKEDEALRVWEEAEAESDREAEPAHWERQPGEPLWQFSQRIDNEMKLTAEEGRKAEAEYGEAQFDPEDETDLDVTADEEQVTPAAFAPYPDQMGDIRQIPDMAERELADS